MRYEVPFTSIGIQKVLNGSGQARISLGTSAGSRVACCEIVKEAEPWHDELLIYRDKDIAFVGPLITVQGSLSGGELYAQDLFQWMEWRWLGPDTDYHFSGDLADIFHSVFDVAYEQDPSPNISVTTRDTGIDGLRDFRGRDLHRAGDILRELTRTGLDFTMVGRQLVGGGQEIFEDQTPLILHDDGVSEAEIVKEGTNFATDVAVTGATLVSGGDPVFGRSQASVEHYGLIQKSYAELLIEDSASCNANAAARLAAMQPAPRRVKATLSQEAAFGWGDLIPGRRMDVRLVQGGCIEVMEEMRLLSVDVGVSAGENIQETVSIDLVPVGLPEEN